MFRHVAMWKFNDEFTPGQLRENAIKIKAGLEELTYEVHGVISIDVYIDPVRGGDDGEGQADIMVDCCFEHSDAYDDYLEHPRHKALETLIEACTEETLCMDFKDDEEDDLI